MKEILEAKVRRRKWWVSSDATDASTWMRTKKAFDLKIRPFRLRI